MPDESLGERLAAVERALVADGDPEATIAVDRTALRDRVAALEEDVAELEAAVQAVRGYVGGVRHVNQTVEQRADAAMAKAQTVERALAGADHPGVDLDGGPDPEPADQPEDTGGEATDTPAPDGRANSDDEEQPADPVGDASRDGAAGTGNICPRCGNVGTASTADARGGPGDPDRGATDRSSDDSDTDQGRTNQSDARPRYRPAERRPGIGRGPTERRGDDGLTGDVWTDLDDSRPGTEGGATALGEQRVDADVTPEADPEDPPGLLARLREVL
jgi:hypothetical protein